MAFDAANFFAAGVPAFVEGFSGARQTRRQQELDREFLEYMKAEQAKGRESSDMYNRAMIMALSRMLGDPELARSLFPDMDIPAAPARQFPAAPFEPSVPTARGAWRMPTPTPAQDWRQEWGGWNDRR